MQTLHLAELVPGAMITANLLSLLGVHMDLGGHDVTQPVMLVYAASFGALGYLIGRLAQASRSRS